MMRICFFGDHDPAHSRVQNVLKGLARLEVPVLTCTVPPGGIFRTLRLWSKLVKIKGEYDVVIVPGSGSLICPLLASLFTEAPVVWLVHTSRYDRAANDHAQPVRSLRTFFLWIGESMMAAASDIVVLPSRAYADFFASTFGLPPQKVAWTYMGADDEQFKPGPDHESGAVFEVVYSGPFTPSVGAEVLVRAAKLLEAEEGLHFTIIGEGVDQKGLQSLITELASNNIVYLPFAAPGEIERRLRTADVIIGLLGDTPLVLRMLPERVFSGAASARAMISGLSSAIAEAFTVDEQIVLVKPGDAEDLALKIRSLKGDPVHVRQLGLSAYHRYSAIGTPESIARRLIEALESVRK